MDRTSAVSLDRYWNFIGVPLFFIVLSFGVYVLYKIGPLQSAGQSILPALIASWKRVPRTLAPAGATATAAPGKAGPSGSVLAAVAAARGKANAGTP